MKYIVLICSVYLLAISVFPCNDAQAKGNRLYASQQIHSEDPHDAEIRDFCSPFCTCTCCNISFNFQYQIDGINALQHVVLRVEKTALRDFNFVSDYFGNIWQPPKINS